MKKILILTILGFITLTTYAQKDTLVDMGVYKVLYSQKYKNPLEVSYKLYKPKSNFKRGNETFHKRKGIITSGNEDYRDNVYDKGHMAAAEAFSDTQAHLDSTFSYLNCAVQFFSLNRGVWKSLEMHERQWAQQDSLYVVNTIIFNKPLHPMKSGAFIPDYFQKSIKFLSTGKVRTFKFPNLDPKSSNFEDYEVKVKKK